MSRLQLVRSFVGVFDLAHTVRARQRWLRVVPIASLASLALAQSQSVSRISIDSTGVQGNSLSADPFPSTDGRFIAFSSAASNLVAGDTNGTLDVFVRDRVTHTTSLASVSSAGAQGDSFSGAKGLSADGRFVLMQSDATTLVVSDTNGVSDIFVHDRMTGATERVNVSSSGAEANGPSQAPAMSADGRIVAFHSQATNLVPGDTTLNTDIFVRDRQTNTTTRVSVDSAGVGANSYCYDAAVSADGRVIAFDTNASNLVPGDTNGAKDVFVHDRQTGATTRVSLTSSGAQSTTGGYSGSARLSVDGRLVAFLSDASDLVVGDTNGESDVFVRDLTSSTTTRVSVGTNGVQSNGPAEQFDFSADGNWVVFQSRATNLAPGISFMQPQIFLHDRVRKTTRMVSVSFAGVYPSAASFIPHISLGGSFVTFTSQANDIVHGDTNAAWDVFITGPRTHEPSTYCTPGTSAAGCVATMDASAQPSVNHFVSCNIHVANVDGQRNGIIFFGLKSIVQPWCVSGGTSELCVKPPTMRATFQNSGGTFGQCDGSFALDWDAFTLANPNALGAPWSSGEKVYVQSWFRDPVGCRQSSLSNAVQLIYQP